MKAKLLMLVVLISMFLTGCVGVPVDVDFRVPVYGGNGWHGGYNRYPPQYPRYPHYQGYPYNNYGQWRRW